MDALTRTLQSFLVEMGLRPDDVPHDIEHNMEHLLHLLDADDEEAVTHYYGLFGQERRSLDELAKQRHLSNEDMMERIDKCVRRLAVTPEWQTMITTKR